MSAADGEREFVVINGDAEAPVLGYRLACFDSLFPEICGEVVGEAAAPEARFDFLLFIYVSGKFIGPELDKGFHFSNRYNRGCMTVVGRSIFDGLV